MSKKTTRTRPRKLRNDEDRITFCTDWIKRIDVDNDQVTIDRENSIKYYRSDKLGNEVEGRSQFVTSDLMDTIEWIMPSLMKIFAGGDEVCKISPRGEEDEKPAKLLNELVNWQMRRLNDWFIVIHDSLKDALLLKTGIIKYQWITEERRVPKEYEGLTEEQAVALLQQPNVEVTDFEPVESAEDPSGVTYNLTLVNIIKEERPLVEAVPAEDVGFMPDARGLDKSFVYHRCTYEPWEIVEEFGEDVMQEIEEMHNTMLGDSNADQVRYERLEDLGGALFYIDEERDVYYIYECYYHHPENGTPWLTKICGDIVLADEENQYERPPFRVMTPVRMSHRIIGNSMYDLVKQLQKLRTTLIRQILDNIYFSNNGRVIGNPDRVSLDDFLNNNVPGGFIRGDPDSIKELGQPQLQPWSFKLLEWVGNERDSRTGVSQYFQGVEQNSLNQTAHGMAQLVNQSQQKIDMIARLIAEMGIAPLIQDIINMNIQFMQQDQSIRVANKWVEINPDDIVGRFDTLVEVGIGTGTKDQIVAQMQQLLGIYAQLMKAGVPIVTPENAYNAMKELIKAMGYRNTNDFVSDPDTVTSVKQLLQVMMPIALQSQNPQILAIMNRVAQGFGINLQNNPQLQSPGEGNATQPNLPQNPAQPQNPLMTPGPEGGA